jgi:endonuclease/exonuclease/phosphatase family protein
MRKFGLIAGISAAVLIVLFMVLYFMGIFKDKIKSKDLYLYTIVYSQEASQPVISAAKELSETINKVYGTELPVFSEAEAHKGKYEILIGKTQRNESVSYVDKLRSAGYGYGIEGKKIVITGRNSETTILALQDFIENVLNRNNGDNANASIFYSEDDNKTVQGEYLLSELSVGKTSIDKFRIVYPGEIVNGEDILADSLASQVSEITGYVLEAVCEYDIDDSAENEIYVGDVEKNAEMQLNENQYYIGFDGKKIRLYGNSSEALYRAVNTLIELFLETADIKHRIELESGKIYDFDLSEMRAMSFNVYCANLTNERVDRVLDIVEKYLPDTFGVQEATLNWMRIFHNKLGHIYKYVGVGRDGEARGEYSAVWYNAQKFDLIDSGTKWLSDTPEVVSKVEESSLNRIFTYALLSRKSDGQRVFVINTHLEHKSKEARNKQIAVLMDFVDNYRDYPIVLTGDFNSKPDSAVYKVVLGREFLDSAKAANVKYEAATFTNYGASESIIDYVFVSKNGFEVEEYRVCNEKINSNFPSDHHPVLVKYRLK